MHREPKIWAHGSIAACSIVPSARGRLRASLHIEQRCEGSSPTSSSMIKIGVRFLGRPMLANDEDPLFRLMVSTRCIITFRNANIAGNLRISIYIERLKSKSKLNRNRT